jgi:hypothetical protein
MTRPFIVQCDASKRLIDDSHEIDGVVKCPSGVSTDGTVCLGREPYERQTSKEIVDLVSAAMRFAYLKFPHAAAARPTPPVVWTGNGPLTVHLPHGEPIVYFGRNAMEDQIAFQLAHEVVHAVMPPGNVTVHHWTHEMLATVFSIEFLRKSGSPYLQLQEGHLVAGAAGVSMPVAMKYVSAATKQGQHTYGRLYVVGKQILERDDWEGLVDMATGNADSPLAEHELRERMRGLDLSLHLRPDNGAPAPAVAGPDRL